MRAIGTHMVTHVPEVHGVATCLVAARVIRALAASPRLLIVELTELAGVHLVVRVARVEGQCVVVRREGAHLLGGAVCVAPPLLAVVRVGRVASRVVAVVHLAHVAER